MVGNNRDYLEAVPNLCNPESMQRPTPANLMWIAVVAVTYYACARLGLMVAFDGFSGSAVWPASGVAFAAVILLGRPAVAGILVGAFVANLIVQLNIGVADLDAATASSLLIALGNTAEACVGAWLLRRMDLHVRLFDDVHSCLWFVAVTLLSCLLGSIVGTSVLGGFGATSWDSIVTVWITWFTGDTVGVLIVTPVIIAWAQRKHTTWPNPRFAELLILLAALTTTTYLVFVHELGEAMAHTLPFVLMPLLLLAAFRHPLLETTTAVLVVSTFAIWGTMEGSGPFAVDSVNESLVMYQGFSGIVSITILILKAALMQLRTSEAQFTSLFKSHLIGIALSDDRQRIVVANRAFLRMTGYHEADLPIAWTALRPVAPDGTRSRTRYLETGAYLAREQEIIHQQGHVLPVMIGSAVIDRSMHHRIISIVLDLSARKKAERQHEQLQEQLRQAQKLEAVGTLATGVAHDFNNIITAILGYTHALDDLARDNPKAREAMDGIVQISTQASEVTRSLLTFSRQVPARRIPIVLGDLVEEVVRMLQRVLPASIHIISNVPERQLWILGDATQLNQVLLNLAVNARDAMPRGGELRITVEYKRLDDAVQLKVEDTGTGMPEDIRQRAFEPFFTTKPREQGTGLGLSTALGIVKDHDAQIDITSAPDAGCCITMTFPSCHADTRPPPEPHQAPPRPRCHGTALVVEDNDQVRAVIVHALRESGFVVMEARDGARASDVFAENKSSIKLAVVDIDLPRKSGAQCIVEFKATAPETRIIAISGNLNAEKSVPPDTAFLHKPFSMVELCTLASQLMNGRGPTTE